MTLSVPSRLLLSLLAVSLLQPVMPVVAQRGALIEDLFRTIAESHLEREQRKRLEAERVAKEQRKVKPSNQPFNVPGPIFPGQILPGQVKRPGTIQTPSLDRSRRPAPPAINVRSREAREFAQYIVSFSEVIRPLVQEMRTIASRNQSIGNLLPEAYHLSADTQALIQRCDGLSSLTPIVPIYSELDARWRQLSFKLRALDGLNDQSIASIRSCDSLVGKMSRQLKIQPQFDRHAIHDLLIVCTTHMQSLLDDLQLARATSREIERLSHDGRLLRQRLLREADRVDDTTYAELVTRFTDFVGRWGAFSEKVYALNDPHLQLRLDRIRECGDQTYGLLWIPPPYSASTLTATAKRLERGCEEILDQLTIRAMVTLKPQDQVRVLEASRRMSAQSRQLTQATKRGASRGEMQQLFVPLDSDWSFLRQALYQIPQINRATLAVVDHETERIRSALGISGSEAQPIAHEELVQVAAALEGSAEYLDADLKRYEKYLKPDSYRKSLAKSSHDLHHHAKELHAKLSNRSDLRSLQIEAEHLLDGWQQLSKDMSLLTSRGLTERRAANLQRAQQEIVPLIAQISAALIQ